MSPTPTQLLDMLWESITTRYCDEQTIDLKESLNEAREALVELESPMPYEPDEMDLSREDRLRIEEELVAGGMDLRDSPL